MRLRELTPLQYRCGIGACPAVFLSEQRTVLVVGAVVDAASVGLTERVAPDEAVIQIDLDLVRKSLNDLLASNSA